MNFITPAYAQAAGASPGPVDMVMQFAPFLVIIVIMYFLILRPQRQRQKQHQEMISNVRRGDTIVTSGGLIGKIVKVVDEAEVQVELSEGIRVRVLRSAIQDVRAKGEPVNDNAS
ncbi:protein translocase subunit yajC [Pseudoxanthobacter soli DSM 19599]|uniref:Sec translocon accessory complex subunit YajC n=1 Tax=Pseudoxanthobacter soli DSM 19599 TaxID=1123029 RepID=A0A1M7ZLG8_9HYPH|nr:preprotein translocase subunit YajC [Pseudoxanthobacter soli]SHO65740.1 protein translocase subunit yajC [Pseudoxanthobacter soli DSM 19599]